MLDVNIAHDARWWIVLLVLILLACSLFIFNKGWVLTRHAPVRMTIARTGGIPSSLFWIAEDKGYFRDEGLDVQYLDYDAGQSALDALREKRADITASGELPIVMSILRGDRIKILAELESDYGGKNFIARRDRGISSPKDLVGKKVGVTFGTVNEFQLDSLLKAYGVDERKVTLVNISFADASKALLAGNVDAVSARQATIVQLEQDLKDKGIVFSTEGIYTFRYLLVGNSDFIDANPQAVEKLLRALVRAEDFERADPQEVKSITAIHTKLEQQVIDDVWDSYHFSINLSQPIFITLEDEARWLMSRDPEMPKQQPDFLDYMYFKALEEAKPGSVTFPHL